MISKKYVSPDEMIRDINKKDKKIKRTYGFSLGQKIVYYLTIVSVIAFWILLWAAILLGLYRFILWALGL